MPASLSAALISLHICTPNDFLHPEGMSSRNVPGARGPYAFPYSSLPFRKGNLATNHMSLGNAFNHSAGLRKKLPTNFRMRPTASAGHFTTLQQLISANSFFKLYPRIRPCDDK